MNKLTKLAAVALTMFSMNSCTAPQATQQAQPEDRKMVIYQVFTRLFGSDNPNPQFNGDLSVNGSGKLNDFTQTALDSIRAMGMTHIWYTGVIEHASIYSIDTLGGIQKNHPGVIKGKAGSPYAIKDYYDVNAYMATNVDKRMEEFEALVERSHKAGLKVVIDFVPNHVARGYHSDVAPAGVKDFGQDDDITKTFSVSNNYYYIPNKALKPQFSTEIDGSVAYEEYPARVTGNDVFSAEPHINDWYETIKLNYGVDYQNNRQTHFNPIPDTWNKMRDILLFWAGKNVDAFRCDMAEMVPKEFWGWVINEVNAQYPDVIFIAEIYNPNSYADYIHTGKFDYLYDKVGLYDTLKAVIQGRSHVRAITQSREKIAHVQPYMLNFLENHDEQRIAWHEFAGNAQAGIPMALISTLSDSIPMMMYFGQELGEESPQATGFGGADGRTTIFDFWTYPVIQAWRNGGKFDGASLTAEQRQLRNQYIALLKLSNHESLFIDGKFIDLSAHNPEANGSVYAFARSTPKGAAFVISNLSNKEVTTTYTLPAELSQAKFNKYLFGNGQKNIIKDGKINITLKPYEGVVFK